MESCRASVKRSHMMASTCFIIWTLLIISIDCNSISEEYLCDGICRNTSSCVDICESWCECVLTDDGGTIVCTDLPHGDSKILSCLLPAVTSITFSNCKLGNISLTQFTSLQDFTLRDSQIDNFTEDALNGLNNLQEVAIVNTPVGDLPEALFLNSDDIEHLIIRNSTLSSFEHGLIGSMDNLQTLDVSNNQIPMLNAEWLSGLPVVVVNVSGNLITNLPNYTFNSLPNLTELDLNFNLIEKVENLAFVNLPLLSILGIKKNRLDQLPSGILPSLPSLLELDVAGNHILSESFQNTFNSSNLRKLDISGNRFDEILPSFFAGLPELTNLKADEMSSDSGKLVLHNDSFRGLTNLHAISLSSNGIEFLPSGIMPATSLIQTLQLQQNSLSVLPRQVFVNAGELKTADVYGNPLHCDCGATWIRREMGNDEYEWIAAWSSNATALICSTPLNLDSYKVADLHLDDLTCSKAFPVNISTDEDENNNRVRFQATFHPGIPSVHWSLPDGGLVYPSISSAPENSPKTAAVDVQIKSDHSVWTQLTVMNPDSSSSGTYTAYAENAGGKSTVTFQYEHKPQKYQHTAAIVVGVLGMVAIFVLAVGCFMYWKRQQASIPYRELGNAASGEGALSNNEDQRSYGTSGISGQASMSPAAQSDQPQSEGVLHV